VETLELLEELLGEYTGTLLLVSHDRDFIDNVVTSTLVLEGDGQVGEYIGGYTEWLRQKPIIAAARASNSKSNVAPAPAPTPVPVAAAPKKKLSFKEQRELDLLPAKLEELEAEIAKRTAAMNDPKYFQQDAAAIARGNEELAKVQAELDTAFARWEELEG
jgi:ATP-binding cassette subfamily F protein uup